MKLHIGRIIFIIMGIFSLIVGIIGVFVPLLPTTPLVLLSGWFFARSSGKLHYWLRNNLYFGKMITAWEEKRGLTIREKRRMVLLAEILMVISFIVCTNTLGRIVIGLIMTVPIIVAVLIKTRYEDETE